MKKIAKWISENWINFFSLVFSFIAIIISYESYQISKQTIEFEEEKISFEATPALSEIVDSVYIHFKANNENSELQTLQINFPDSLSKDIIKLNTKPLQIQKSQLELLAKNFLEKKLKTSDSIVTVGEFIIPVLIDYNVIVYGRPNILREFRFLVFTLDMSKNYSQVKFANSFLVNRASYPIKGQSHWKMPFADIPQNKIINQDKVDVETILNAEFLEQMKKINDTIY